MGTYHSVGVATVVVIEEAMSECGISNDGVANMQNNNDPKLECCFPFSLSYLLSATQLITTGQC